MHSILLFMNVNVTITGIYFKILVVVDAEYSRIYHTRLSCGSGKPSVATCLLSNTFVFPSYYAAAIILRSDHWRV